jgi:hypothetical protein
MKVFAKVTPLVLVCVSLAITLGARQRVSTQSGPLDRINPNSPAEEPPLHIDRLTFPEQRYRLIAQYPNIWSCDPDVYPIAHLGGERKHAIQGFDQIVGDHAAFQVMARHLGLDKVAQFSDDQKVLIYREYKKLLPIELEPQDDEIKFTVQVPDPPHHLQYIYPNGQRITGLIDSVGHIRIQETTPVVLTCPVCLAAGTRIDTPNGEVAVQDLKLNMLVWTLDGQHQKVAAPILKVSAVPVPSWHLMVRLRLSDGRELIASPGHPTADGRAVEELQADENYDGATIRSARMERYQSHDLRTFDFLPAGGTGFYWANGILLASTLK